MMNVRTKCICVVVCLLVALHVTCGATCTPLFNYVECLSDSVDADVDYIGTDSQTISDVKSGKEIQSIYALPYSVTNNVPNWHRMWINTAVLSGAFVGSLFVLECLPEDATSWNRKEIRSVPMFKRWFKNIFKRGPEWDHDKFYFNFILHPYAGAAYYMSARSCGFNAWRSLLYCSCISTIGWEFGVEAFMERPSYQDLFVTPLVGSAIGEGFYCIKRHIAQNDYRLCGSKVLGNVVAFLCDPVNEFVGLFAGNDARHINDAPRSVDISLSPIVTPSIKGVSFSAVF